MTISWIPHPNHILEIAFISWGRKTRSDGWPRHEIVEPFATSCIHPQISATRHHFCNRSTRLNSRCWNTLRSGSKQTFEGVAIEFGRHHWTGLMFLKSTDIGFLNRLHLQNPNSHWNLVLISCKCSIRLPEMWSWKWHLSLFCLSKRKETHTLSKSWLLKLLRAACHID